MVDPISSIHKLTFDLSRFIPQITIDRRNRMVIIHYNGNAEMFMNAIVRWLENRGVKVVVEDGEEA